MPGTEWTLNMLHGRKGGREEQREGGRKRGRERGTKAGEGRGEKHPAQYVAYDRC